MINSDWYRYFLSAAETGSFTKGAEALGITQSALSQGVKNLEKYLGTRLFIREPRGTRLSGDGGTLLSYVRESYRLLSLGEQEIWERNHLHKGKITLGAGDTVCKHFLLPWIGSFHSKYPGIRINIVNRTSAELLELLENRSIDIAVITAESDRTPQYKQGIGAIKLFTVQDCFACSPGLYSKSRGQLSADILKNNLLLLPSPRTATRRNLSAYLEGHNIAIREAIDFESVELQIEFAKLGMGIAFAPGKSMADQIAAGELEEIALPTPVPPRQVWGMYHSQPSKRLEIFISGLKSADGPDESLKNTDDGVSLFKHENEGEP